MTHSKTKLAALAVMALLCCSTMLISMSVRAQCPPCSCPLPPVDDYNHDTTTVPWIPGDTCVYIDGCWVKICYISRQTSSGQFDYAVDQICYWASCATDSATLLGDASHWLMHNNPSHFPCPTCPSTDIEWNENFITCWTYYVVYDPASGDTVHVLSMCSQHGWCINGYTVCCTNGVPTFTFLLSASKPCPGGHSECFDLGQTLCPKRIDTK